jgi:hypothetical protein
MRYHLRHEDMTDEERAERFRWFTPGQLAASLRRKGLPDRCDDPDALRAGAAVDVAAEARAAREQAAAADPAA